METTIKIDLKEGTCNIEIHDLFLEHINSLSVITQAVADNFKSTLILAGADLKNAEIAANLLLQEKHDIQYILKGAFQES